MKRLFSTFLVMGVLLSGSTGIQGQEVQDDNSSLDIRNDVIYGGDQESNQIDHYDSRSDLFLEKNNEQSRAIQKKKRDHLEAIDERLFQTDTAEYIPAVAPSSGSGLFSEDYVTAEFIAMTQSEESSNWSTVFFWSALTFGGLGILVLGWILGRRFSRLFTGDKEWL